MLLGTHALAHRCFDLSSVMVWWAHLVQAGVSKAFKSEVAFLSILLCP